MESKWSSTILIPGNHYTVMLYIHCTNEMFHSPPQVRAEILERSSHSYLLEEHSDKLSSYPSQWN